MAELSPQAQAVLDAAYREIDYIPQGHVRWAVASALRALAANNAYEFTDWDEDWCNIVIDVDDIYAIATELENAQ